MTLDLTSIPGIGPRTREILAEHGFDTLQKIAKASVDALAQLPGFSAARAEKCIAEAKLIVAEQAADKKAQTSEPPPSQPKEKQKKNKGSKGKEKKEKKDKKDKKGKKDKKTKDQKKDKKKRKNKDKKNKGKK
jgi:nucleotidyltransferase/DNA polymerase involved in DNA repair